MESSLDQPDEEPEEEHEEDDEEEEPAREELTAEEIVQAGVAGGQLDVASVPIDQHELDVKEEQLIQAFVRDGCKCDLGPNHSPCSTSITVDHYRSVRCQMADLEHNELDLVVMGQVMAGCFSAETFRKQERSTCRSFTVFHHNGTRICQKTFLFLHTMGYTRFKAIKASFMANGVVARVHGNKGKSHRKDRLTLKQIQDVIQFIMNYAGVCTSVEMCVCMCVSRERERKEGE